MPGAQNNPVIDAKRFAALLAGFDTGNGSEEKALAKGRALRRMAAGHPIGPASYAAFLYRIFTFK